LHLSTAGSRQHYKQVDRFITPSVFLRDKYVQYGFPADRMEVQGHFLPEMPTDPPIPSGSYLLYLGRLSKEKGVSWLLEQYKFNPSLPRLVMAGDGPLRGDAENHAGKHFQYVGFIRGDEKTRLIRGALAVVMPSLCYENYPMAIAEANAAGVPAIVADHGGLREMVQPSVNGERFAPGDGDSFQQAVRRLASVSDTEALRRRTQQHARHTFSADTFAEARLRLYQRLQKHED
jgi:glycosyltransferase involved in cell wall biosynthesis